MSIELQKSRQKFFAHLTSLLENTVESPPNSNILRSTTEAANPKSTSTRTAPIPPQLDDEIADTYHQESRQIHQCCQGVLPPELVENGTNKQGWLQLINHNMWSMQLQDAGDVIYIGWLLYSTEEFECTVLQHEIRWITGVNVSLTYREMDGGPNGGSTPPRICVKAIHLDIHSKDFNNSQKAIEQLYSSDSNTFPLGIWMHLVPAYQRLTNSHAQDKF